MTVRRGVLLAFAWVLPALADEVARGTPPVSFVPAIPPSIRVGSWLKVEPRVAIQGDLRGTSPDVRPSDKLYDTRLVRLGAEGRVLRDFDYTVLYSVMASNHRLVDALVNYRRFQRAQLQAGRFRVPFGLDMMTDRPYMDFVERSRVARLLSPGRDTGVMVHGDFRDQRLHYAAGVFRHGGENTEIEQVSEERKFVPSADRMLVARVAGSPSAFLRVPEMFDRLEVGAAVTSSRMTAGLNSLRGSTASGETIFPRMYVQGMRSRRGVEMKWQLRSLMLKGEYVTVREERRGQSLQGADLPPLRSRGWYVSATQPLIGRSAAAPQPSLLRTLVPGTRLGLIEAAARYEQIRFGSESTGAAAPSRSPRAANVVENADRVWTLGINWYATRYTKFQFNAIHETLRDPARTPLAGIAGYWTLVGRIQVAM